MSESCREQHPLLCDDGSEEEHFSPHYQRRFRPMIYRGRARNQAKGATAILNQWPDHWTSSVTYWWIGLGMITFTVLILYNSVIALALLPTTHLRSTKFPTANKIVNSSDGRSPLPDVFMHVVVHANEEVNLNKYLPYIELFSKKYLDFKYNFIILVNDTSESDTLSAEEHNDIAFNSLWSQERIHEGQTINNNIHVQHVTLSSYMTASPLNKYWKRLPHQFTEFLVKAISIWNKGGIAFNPLLLESAQHAIYTEKLENIFKKYRKCSENNSVETKMKKHFNKQKGKQKTRVNNIQDIIDILEHEDGSFNSTQYSLTEAENRNTPKTVHSGRKLLSTEMQIIIDNETETKTSNDKIMHSNPQFIKVYETGQQPDDVQNVYIDVETRETLKTSTQGNKVIDQSLENSKTTKLSLLPLFLEFLFHDKSKDNLHKTNTEETIRNSPIRQRKSAINLDILKKNNNTNSVESSTNSNEKYSDEYRPVIISKKGMHDAAKNIKAYDIPIECENLNQLTIDLKGNILATDTACHAFIGSVFSNVIHHTEEETLHDFIIAELSAFCKGLLSSCKGIDVILL